MNRIGLLPDYFLFHICEVNILYRRQDALGNQKLYYE